MKDANYRIVRKGRVHSHAAQLGPAKRACNVGDVVEQKQDGDFWAEVWVRTRLAGAHQRYPGDVRFRCKGATLEHVHDLQGATESKSALYRRVFLAGLRALEAEPG